MFKKNPVKQPSLLHESAAVHALQKAGHAETQTDSAYSPSRSTLCTTVMSYSTFQFF